MQIEKGVQMLTTKFFPSLLIILDVLAAAGYALHGLDEWRKVVYWLAAAVLTFVVTW
jgi:hypothetical protein